ncbi:MAG: T9SS type A sorting domain-containing protein [Taibaiella sp.]|jgi:hypothetical protein
MKISKYILTVLLLSACWLPARAQFYLDGLNSYNNGGIVSYYDNPGIVTSSGDYTALAAALTVHGGLTLQVDGLYTASGNAVDSFTGDGSTAWPPVDAVKTIAGSVAPTFDIAKFMNGATQQVNITNTQGINVGQRIDFANGITTTVRSNIEAGAVRLLDNATYTNTALGDAQHVNGYVSKTGDDAFTYPVGSGTDLRTLAISAPATATDQYSVAWMVGDPTTNGDPSDAGAMHSTAAVTSPIASVSMAGQWDWIPVSGTGAGLTVTVSIPDLSATGVLAADLRLVGWNGTSWIDLSGSSNATGNTEGSSLSGTMQAGITAIGIGSTSVVLPIVFNDFSVVQRGCTAVLNWSTAMERNNDYFQVERSADGRNFKVIGSKDAKGNSDVLQHYTYTDNAPLPGTNFYRIAQVDLDGKRSTTGVEDAYFSCGNAGIKVYPTLTKGTVYVSLPEGYEQAKLSVFNILSQQLNLSATDNGQRLRTIQLNGLSAGTYFLKVIRGNTVESFKIVYKP